jgi:hypothetical protein
LISPLPHPEPEDPRRGIPQQGGTRLHAHAKRHAASCNACAGCHQASLGQALIALNDAHRPLTPALNGRQI